ncbi:MAG: NADPH-dependent F420 reductase [Chitinophagales bacterium]
MKIAVLGTGAVGQTIAEKLLQTGNEVMMGTRNVEEALSRNAKDMFGRPPFSEWHIQHSAIKVGTFSEAAAFGEMVVNATNGFGSLNALQLAGKENLANKVMLDVSNPLDFSKGMPPSLFVSNTDSLGEQIQNALPDTKVVKGLNTMNAWVMVNPSLVPGDHNVFLSGNDAGAKSKVTDLLETFGWTRENVMDIGDITTARGAEQLVAMWVRILGAIKNPIFNFHVVVGPPPPQM